MASVTKAQLAELGLSVVDEPPATTRNRTSEKAQAAIDWCEANPGKWLEYGDVAGSGGAKTFRDRGLTATTRAIKDSQRVTLYLSLQPEA